MDIWLLVPIFVAVILVAKFFPTNSEKEKSKANYLYSKKDSIMSPAEEKFFRRLELIAGDRYYVFPQIHLSALLKNETKGRYWKAGFRRTDHRSVDYVLCDKTTLKTVYAVELDDTTHDSEQRKYRDGLVEEMLSSVNIPLVRFRDVAKLSDEDMANRFADAKESSISQTS